MGREKSPQQKKAESLKKDRRNAYGENSKSSRKNIPRAKARDHREARRVVRQGLIQARGAKGERAVDDAQTAATAKRHPRFKKEPDKPLGKHLADKRARRPKETSLMPRSQDRALDPPPMALAEADAVEVLRVWAAPGRPQQLTLRTTWKNPQAWGLVLVDLARHAAAAYATEGHDPQAVLAAIRQFFDAEWLHPTDLPVELPEDSSA
jgi:hypothetical protein